MKITSHYRVKSTHLAAFVVLLALTVTVQAATDNWQRSNVDWRAGGGRRITGIYAPHDKPFPSTSQKRIVKNPSKTLGATATSGAADQIDSPPVDGFTVYVAIAFTDARSADDSNRVAQPHSAIVGRFLTEHPQTDFAMGVFDTGGSFHLMGYAAAQRTGILAADLLSPYKMDLMGATGSASVWLSRPLAVFIDGLSAIDPNTLILNHSKMVGQSNVAIAVGQEPKRGVAELGTVIGTPLCVTLATAIFNDRQITVVRDSNEYAGPDARFYSLTDPCIPQYADRVSLNLLPAGASDVEYYLPYRPSLIAGDSWLQGWFFLDSVDLHEGEQSSLDRHGFLLDTGSQLTVISSSVASKLNLDSAAADFKVEIRDITHQITIIPGFYVDVLEMPTATGRLKYTHVPVIVLDIGLPEGVSFDGIIGTNLFTDFNLLIHGGGLPGQDPPFLEFQRLTPLAAGDTAGP
jgi:hypothetical protein